MNNVVINPYEYFADPTKGRPIFNGFVYIGEPDTDPEVPANQKQVYARQEDGNDVAIPQPVLTNAGGYPTYNGSVVILTVQGSYSVKVNDKQGNQLLYQANATLRDQGALPLLAPRAIGDGIETVFASSATAYASPNYFTVTLDGVKQRPITDYDIDLNGNVVLVAPAPFGSKVDIIFYNADILQVVSSSNSTVTATPSGVSKTLGEWTEYLASPETIEVTATGTTTARSLADRFGDIDSDKRDFDKIDYGFGSGDNYRFAINNERMTSGKSLSGLSRAIKQAIGKDKSAIRMFLNPNQTGSVIETEQRLIESPLDHFDVSVTIVVVPTSTAPTIVAQNLSATSADREFHIYYTTASSIFTIIIGGTEYATSAITMAAGDKFRFRLSGFNNVMSVVKNGTVVYQSSAAFSGPDEEISATTTFFARHNGLPTLYSGSSELIASDATLVKKKKIIILGASIMQGAFTSPAACARHLHDIDSDFSEVVEYATSGDTVADTLAILPTVLSEQTEPCLFFMHIGGNDVTETKPFLTAPLSRLEFLRDSIREIVTTVKSSGHDFCLANLTFRQYPSLVTDNDGSLPYNKSIHEPLIRELTPEWWDYSNNKPVVDMYEWAKANTSYMQADGVHYTTAGYIVLRDFILDTLNDNYTNFRYVNFPFDNAKAVGADIFTSFYNDGAQEDAKLVSYNQEYIFAGINGVQLTRVIPIEGIGSQFVLKNKTGSTISAGSIVDAADLAQVFFDASGVLTESVDPLPSGSKWKMISGGTLATNTCKTFVRIS